MKPVAWTGGIIAAIAVLLILGNGLDARQGADKVLLENVSQGKKVVVPIPDNRALQVSFIHSLYGGYQTENFIIVDQSLDLRQVKFESYDALLYYTGGSHTNERREGSYWVTRPEYKTDSINFIIPQVQRDFSVTVGNQVFNSQALGNPSDIIKISVGKGY